MRTAKITVEGNTYALENRWIKRVIRVDAHGVITTNVQYLGEELLKNIHHEFQMAVNRVLLTGYSERLLRIVDGNEEQHTCDLTFLDAEVSVPDEDFQRLELRFAYGEHRLTLRYEIAEALPAMRKRLLFTAGDEEAMLENVIFDDTPIAPGEVSECNCYVGMNPQPVSGCFTRSGDTDFLRIHTPVRKKGFYLGNTAPGLLRYFLVYPDWDNLMVGYNASSAPFCRHLAPGETFVSAESLTSFYSGTAEDGLDDWRALVRSRLPRLESSDTVMYSSWIPLYKSISEQTIRDLAERAASMGFTAFVIDDGWFLPESDWSIDAEKFPRGLEPVAAHIHSLGLKFGLWFNIGTDYGMKSERERFAALQADGTPKRLGWDYHKSPTVQCFASGHCDRMVAKLDELATRYGVDYFKMDFSSICSPYGILPYGCHATDHAGHHGFADSFAGMYDGFRRLRETLKERHPHLMLDFSFESFGFEEPSIGALACSELNHLSNLNALNPARHTVSGIRGDFYRRAVLLPPERLMHGLPVLAGEGAGEAFLTSLCGAPLVSGDLRKLEPAAMQRLRAFVTAYRKLTSHDPLTGFAVVMNRQDADAFRRYSEDGRELWCVFNRTNELLRLESAKRLLNVETNAEEIVVPPHECAMFTTL